MKSLQILARFTLVAIEAITGKRIVALDGSHTINKGIGVAEYDAASGSPVAVCIQGVIDVESGAAFAAGDLLTADANGKAIKANPALIAEGAYQQVVGIALEAAGGAGEFPLVFVNAQSQQGINNEIKDETTVVAGEAITVSRIVAADGTHTIRKGIGVAKASAINAASVVLNTAGECDVESGAAFAVGDLLTADANGKAVKADPAVVAAGTQIEIIGVAMEAAGGTDELVAVLLGRAIIYGTLDTVKDRMTMVAAEAITTNRIVDAEGKHTVLKGIGVAEAGALQAANVSVATGGVIDVETGGNFAIGDPITADADGKAVKADHAASLVGVYIEVIGIALEQSTGVGQSKSVLLGRFLLAGTDTE